MARIILEVNRNEQILIDSSACYFKKIGDYVQVITGDGAVYMTSKTLEEISDMLDEAERNANVEVIRLLTEVNKKLEKGNLILNEIALNLVC